MLLRRAHPALLLVGGLTAMALSAVVGVGYADATPRGAMDHASVAAHAARVDGPAARLTGDDRRDFSNAERTFKLRLTLAAGPTAIFCAAHLVRCGVLVRRRSRRPVTSLWSPEAGRSPPSSLSIA